MDPDQGPGTPNVTVAQLTIKTGQKFFASVSVQARPG